MRLEVDNGSYTEAASALLDANHATAGHYGALAAGLAQGRGIGGNTAWAGGWCAAYDESAAAVVATFADLVAALGGVHRLAWASVANHERAELGSVLVFDRPAVYVGPGAEPVPSSLPVEVDVLPLGSITGGSTGGPWWWSQVADKLEGFVWPDADTGDLRSLAGHWRNAAFAVERLPAFVAHASTLLGRQVSPEIPMAVAALDQLTASIATVAAGCHDLADACDRHAEDVDHHREEVLQVGAEILVETVAIQTIAHGLAVFTAGGSEVVGQAAQTLRVASAAKKIRSSLATLSLTLVTRLGPVRAGAADSAKAGPGLRRMGQARAIHSSASLEAATQAAATGFTHVGGRVYRSPAGLRYGPSVRGEHRLHHVLLHAYGNAGKRIHSVFAEGTDVLRLVDEAWRLRGASVIGDAGKYVVPMGRTVGSAGETHVTIVVRPGTQRLITAYPSG